MIFDWVVLLLRKVSRPVYNRTLLSSNISSQYCNVSRKILLLSKPTYSARFCCVHVAKFLIFCVVCCRYVFVILSFCSVRVAQFLIFCVSYCRYVFVLFVLLWPLHGLPFFELRLLISTFFMFSLVISTNLWWNYLSLAYIISD